MASKSGPDIIEDGLVLCLDAASKRSYPGTGTVWTDLTGSNNWHVDKTWPILLMLEMAGV